ncbi:MAG: DUF1810 family protein [Trueperaceae bacterium]|nr:DUF1810 family protein [Trueperaceae bacterium]
MDDHPRPPRPPALRRRPGSGRRTGHRRAPLGPNLDRCIDAVLLHDPLDPSALMGWPDDLKLRSSMTLFDAAGAARPAEVLERGDGGQRDAATEAVLEGWRAADG